MQKKAKAKAKQKNTERLESKPQHNATLDKARGSAGGLLDKHGGDIKKHLGGLTSRLHK